MAKFDCLVCDGEISLEYYTTKATTEEVAALLMLWKICTPHARKIDDANTKRQIEMTVA